MSPYDNVTLRKVVHTVKGRKGEGIFSPLLPCITAAAAKPNGGTHARLLGAFEHKEIFTVTNG